MKYSRHLSSTSLPRGCQKSSPGIPGPPGKNLHRAKRRAIPDASGRHRVTTRGGMGGWLRGASWGVLGRAGWYSWMIGRGIINYKRDGRGHVRKFSNARLVEPVDVVNRNWYKSATRWAIGYPPGHLGRDRGPAGGVPPIKYKHLWMIGPRLLDRSSYC